MRILNFFKSLKFKTNLKDFNTLSDILNLIALFFGISSVISGNLYMIPFVMAVGLQTSLDQTRMDYSLYRKISTYVFIIAIVTFLYHIIK